MARGPHLHLVLVQGVLLTAEVHEREDLRRTIGVRLQTDRRQTRLGDAGRQTAHAAYTTTTAATAHRRMLTLALLRKLQSKILETT